MAKILLFIPMYNCEKQIVRVLRQLDSDVMSCIDEVIVVNNRSTDGSEDAAVECAKDMSLPVIVVRNTSNYGLGGSHKVAFNYAIENGFDYLIVLHGDDQGNIHDLIPYIKSGDALKYDSFLGSRFEKDSKLVNYSNFRIFGNHVFNIFMSIILGRKVTDLGSGLNMYKVDYLKSGFYKNFIDTLTFNVYMLIYGVYSKSEFAFFPLTWREEDQISNAKFFKQSKEILKIAFNYLFNKKAVFPSDVKDNTEGKTYTYDIIYSHKG